MTHEVIRREEARLLRILEEYPVNGRKTNTGTIKMIRKEIGNMTFRYVSFEELKAIELGYEGGA